MNVLGLSAFYHESACCLLADGELVAAAAEERFSRVKHDPRLPVEAVRYCLDAGGIGVDALDAIAYYEEPVAKLSRQLWSRPWEGAAAETGELPWLDPGLPERTIRERLGWDGPLLIYPHHLSHAASSFCYAGVPDAAILTIDGVGEWATTTYGRGWHEPGGTGNRPEIELFEEVRFPHSLGLLYSTITAYLGFRVNGGEYKVMGLAPYGEPSYADAVRRLVASGPGGSYRLDLTYFDFVGGRRMDSPALWDLLGGPPRPAGGEITRRHRNVARSLQVVLEEILLEKVRYLHDRVPCETLCMAGGVALNCVAVGRIAREGPFRRLFVQPAAGDAGASLGAAALAWRDLSGRGISEPLRRVDHGPRWSGDEVAGFLDAVGLPWSDRRGRGEELIEEAADRLAAGQVLGWFQGGMELGPRALGSRSILADPRDPEMRDRLNRTIKRREGFRPFAPAVLAERAAEHFDLDHPSPFMLETCRVTSPLELPAITHVDGSARPQTVHRETAPRFARLLEAFERRTGCPILLNTSLNVRGEPIVCTPADALFTLADAGLDALVIENTLVDRGDLPEGMVETLGAWRTRPASGRGRRTSAVSETLYTFV